MMLDYIRNDGGNFYSRTFGIVNSLFERRISIATSNNRDIVSTININNSKNINGGSNFSQKIATISSIGEAIERYSLTSYNPDSFIKSTYSALHYNKPKFEQLRFFLPEQYEYYPSLPSYSINSKINWAVGKSLINLITTAIPASLVYLPYHYSNDEPAISVQLSPGTACHYNFEQAVLTAVLECIERDAFTLYWEAGIKFPQISSIDVNKFLKLKGIEFFQDKIFCIDITTDLDIPVVLTLILSGDSRPPYTSIGIAAAMDPLQALEKSITEAITSWRSSKEIALNTKFSFNEVMEKLTKHPDFFTHAMYHCFVDTRALFFILLDDSPISLQYKNVTYTHKKIVKTSQALEQIRGKLDELNYDFTIVDITPDEIKEHGLHVIRAISCDLVRPTLGLMFRHLNNLRYLNVPQKKGLSSQRNTMQKIIHFKIPSP